MRNAAICFFTTIACGLASAVGVDGADAAADPPGKRDAILAALSSPGALRAASFAAMHAMQANSMRLSGMSAATNFPASANMTPAASEEWGRMLVGDLGKDGVGVPPVLAEDFLAGSTILIGPCDASGAVFAYWNPFWDMLLFVRTGGGELPEPKADGEAVHKGEAVSAASLLGAASGGPAVGKVTPSGKPPKTEQLLWVGGKAFRGEKSGGGQEPNDKSFSETLWLREAGTVRRFREIYPETDGMAFSKGILRIDPRITAIQAEATRAELRTAAYLRLKMIEACFKSFDRKKVCQRATGFLHESDGDALAISFNRADHLQFCQSFAKLPPDARRGFSIYGCIEGGREDMLLFINVEMPRFYATAFFPHGLLDNQEEIRESYFEWYDVSIAESLLDAVKEVENNDPDAKDAGKEATR